MCKLTNCEPTTTHTFLAIEGKVLKVVLAFHGSEIFCQDQFPGEIAERALATGCILPPTVNIRVGEASEADLLAAQKTSPDKAVELEQLLAYRRAIKAPRAQPPPLQVEIVNPQEVGRRDQLLTIKRDEAGRLESAVSHQL
jgi:hypothetical protein